MTPSHNSTQLSSAQLHKLAALIRDHCQEQVNDAYHNARMDGLCADGAWEFAVDSLRTINLETVIQTAVGSIK